MSNEKTFILATEFAKEFKRRYRYNLYSLQKVRDTKWWNIFNKVIEQFGDKEEWDAYKYILYVFELYSNIVYPHMLLYNKNWVDYLQHLESRIKTESSIASSLLITFNEIKDWSKKNKYNNLAVSEFFKDKSNFIFLMRKKYSPYFLSISKSFYELYNNLSEEERQKIISDHDLMIKKAVVLNNKKIRNTLSKVLGEEFIGFN